MNHFEQNCEEIVKTGLLFAGDVGQGEGEEDSVHDADSYDDSGFIELSENEVVLRFSITLMNKLKRAAADEGIEIDELAGELITEALSQRAILDAQRPGPSHLITRTGYVPPEAGPSLSQPVLSHHQNNNGNQRGPGRRGNNKQQRHNHNAGNRSGRPHNRPHGQGSKSRGR
jgi:hypothetical protein